MYIMHMSEYICTSVHTCIYSYTKREDMKNVEHQRILKSLGPGGVA